MSSQIPKRLEPVGIGGGTGPIGLPHRRSAEFSDAHARGLRGAGPAFNALIWLLVGIGLVARIAPFFDVDNRILEQFVTEDGYFMLAVARNLAIGNGLSIADGEMPTNGIQPLVTLLFSLGYLVVDGAKKSGVAIAQGMQLVWSLIAAWLLYRLGLKALALRTEGPRIAALAAAAWFASPLTLIHSMNGLETGLYALVALLVALRFVERDVEAETPWSLPATLLSGVLLGVAFWTRNDAAFLILAACLTYLYSGAHKGFSAVSARFGRALIFGATSVLVATPWLGFNYYLFQHIVPISGRAESLSAELFGNIIWSPTVLVEYLFVFLPIPNAYQVQPWVAWVCAGVLLLVALTLPALWERAHRTERSLIVLVLIYGTGLTLFYSVYFGAGWFVARYLFPLSPFIALLWSVGVCNWVAPRLGRVAMTVGAVGMVGVMVMQNYRDYRAGDQHPHFQVIEWAEANIPDSMWAGATQTGTLGYFHDRTVNLDGKVNIDAYYALKNRRNGPYVVTTDIEYLLDWTGMADYLTKPAAAANFRVLVLDDERDLSVLQRRDRIRLGADLAYDRDAVRIARRQTVAAIGGAGGLQAARMPAKLKWRLLYDLAWLEDALENEKRAEARARDALAATEDAQTDTPAWQRREVLSRRQLSNVLRARLRFEDALTEMTRAVELIESSGTASTAAIRRDLALTYLEQGELQWETGDIAGARKRFAAALAVQDDLQAEGYAPIERDRAVSLLSIGDAALALGDAEAAKKAFEASHAIRTQRSERLQGDRQTTYDLALAEARLGRWAHMAGQKAEGRRRIEESIRIRRSLPKIHPGYSAPGPTRALEFNEGVLGISALDVPREAP